MLQKTFLARCDNRACLAKTNIMSGSPEAWLSNDILSKSNTFGLTFDFFVDWAINQISPYVWIKRILLPTDFRNSMQILIILAREEKH